MAVGNGLSLRFFGALIRCSTFSCERTVACSSSLKLSGLIATPAAPTLSLPPTCSGSALVLMIMRIGAFVIAFTASRVLSAIASDPLSTRITPSSPTCTVRLPPAPKMTQTFCRICTVSSAPVSGARAAGRCCARSVCVHCPAAATSASAMSDGSPKCERNRDAIMVARSINHLRACGIFAALFHHSRSNGGPMRHALAGISARAILLVLLSFTAAWAQSASTAQINGTVKDAAGLALPGVSITVTQTDTALTRTVVTDDTGSYTLTSLPVGPYKFEATLQGFRSYVQTGIVLQVNANPTLNVTLQIGQIAEKITVQGAAALVETRSPGVGQVITNQQVLELPLNGRQLTELVFQAGLATGGKGTGDAPGGNVVNTGVRSYPNTTIVVAGGLSNGMTYLLDGGTHNDPFNNLSLPLPFPDAMQEFNVETSALPAQYGHHSAAAVNAVTKSGTNVLHGDAFEFLRDHRLNATNAFAAIGPDGKRRDDGLHRDQFGGTLGGPIVRGKLFFFAGYQGTRINVTPTSGFQFVPTRAMLAGDFSTITSPACNAGRTIALRAPFAGTTVSPAQFSPAALALTSKLPQPINDCGQVFFDRRTQTSERLFISRGHYQRNHNHS